MNQSDSFSINVNVTLFDRTLEDSQKVYDLTIEKISLNTETIKAAAPSGFVGNVSVEVINSPIPVNLATEAPTKASSRASITEIIIPPVNSIALKNYSFPTYLSLSINLMFMLFFV